MCAGAGAGVRRDRSSQAFSCLGPTKTPLSAPEQSRRSLSPSTRLKSNTVPKVSLMLSAASIGRFLSWKRGQKPTDRQIDRQSGGEKSRAYV